MSAYDDPVAHIRALEAEVERLRGRITTCSRCGVRPVINDLRADAWDEGHRFTGYAPSRGENPYRIVLPDEEQHP